MGTARFLVSEELIRELMEMPAGARIQNIVIEKDPTYLEEFMAFRFEVSDPDLPEGIHDVAPTVTEAYRNWDWNIKED